METNTQIKDCIELKNYELLNFKFLLNENSASVRYKLISINDDIDALLTIIDTNFKFIIVDIAYECLHHRIATFNEYIESTERRSFFEDKEFERHFLTKKIDDFLSMLLFGNIEINSSNRFSLDNRRIFSISDRQGDSKNYSIFDLVQLLEMFRSKDILFTEILSSTNQETLIGLSIKLR